MTGLPLGGLHWRYHVALLPHTGAYAEAVSLGSYCAPWEAMDAMREWCPVLKYPARFVVSAQQWVYGYPPGQYLRELLPASEDCYEVATYIPSLDGTLTLGSVVENDAIRTGWLEPLPG